MQGATSTHIARGASLLLLLFAGCDSAVVSRPDLPANQVLLAVDSLIASPQVQALTQALGAPVRYLGRLETPLRVTQVASVNDALLRNAAMLVVVDAMESMPPVGDPLRSLPQAARIDSQAQGDGNGRSRWSTYENVFLPQQTILTAVISKAATVEQVGDLGQMLRKRLERSQLRHRSAQLQSSPGASALPAATTRDRFRIVVPGGYAWSDTSTGWPHSVQIAAARPTRVVTVFWVEEAEAGWLQLPDFLVGMLRDAMWRLQRDRLEEDSVVWLATPQDSPELTAIWQNPDRIAGGPLHTRFVYDAARQRLYGVQALVFLPGADKHRALQEAMALASTFEIVETF